MRENEIYEDIIGQDMFVDKTFLDDLFFYSHYVPPGYPDNLWPDVDQELVLNIAHFKHIVDLETFLENSEDEYFFIPI